MDDCFFFFSLSLRCARLPPAMLLKKLAFLTAVILVFLNAQLASSHNQDGMLVIYNDEDKLRELDFILAVGAYVILWHRKAERDREDACFPFQQGPWRCREHSYLLKHGVCRAVKNAVAARSI